MDETALERALSKERDRSCDQILSARVIGLVAWNLVNAGYAAGNSYQSSRMAAPLLFGYLLVALGLWFAGRRNVSRSKLWLGIPLLDLPVVFGVLWTVIPYSPAPHSLVASGLGIFLILGSLAQLALQKTLLQVTFGAASVLIALLWWRAGLPSAGPAASMLIVVAFVVMAALPRRIHGLVRNVLEEQSRRERLGRYFSPSVSAIIAEQDPAERKPAYREITVLFADLRDFTSMCETLTPLEVADMLRDFHGAMVEVLFANGATLDKFMGDGIMAYFSAPVEQEDHAHRAVMCAIGMQHALDRLNADRAAALKPLLQMGVGLHTGLAIVGDLGPDLRREYTALGDTVNVASRVEGLTKQVGVPILVTDAVSRAARDGFHFEPQGSLPVKGKTAPVNLFYPLLRQPS